LSLLDARRTALPLFLTPVGGDRVGLAALGKPLTALLAEIRHLAHPVCLDYLPTADGVEDHAPQAPLAVAKAADLLDRLARVVAIELAMAAQAVDLRGAVLGPP